MSEISLSFHWNIFHASKPYPICPPGVIAPYRSFPPVAPTLNRQKGKLQKGRGNVRDSDKCSASVDKDSDKGVYDAEGAIETGKGDCTTGDSLARRIAKTIKFSLMADKEYSDEQIVTIVQRQDRSIDSDAILEVWYNWSDWSAYLKGLVNQRIQSGSLMPDEVLEARSYAARLRDFQRKNEQFQAVV